MRVFANSTRSTVSNSDSKYPCSKVPHSFSIAQLTPSVSFTCDRGRQYHKMGVGIAANGLWVRDYALSVLKLGVSHCAKCTFDNFRHPYCCWFSFHNVPFINVHHSCAHGSCWDPVACYIVVVATLMSVCFDDWVPLWFRSFSFSIFLYCCGRHFGVCAFRCMCSTASCTRSIWVTPFAEDMGITLPKYTWCKVPHPFTAFLSLHCRGITDAGAPLVVVKWWEND